MAVEFANTGLMAIFFFIVGLEIKREMSTGELRDPRRVDGSGGGDSFEWIS